MNYRVIAQDILSGEFRDWDLQLDDLRITYTLSGPSEISGTFAPEQPTLNLQPRDAWSTWLHVEQDGLIRASGILQPLALDGPALRVSCLGPTAYLYGLPYLGDYSARGVDPLDVVREVWRHVQSYPDGNLGVTLDDTTSPVRLATDPEGDPYRLAWWDTKDCGQEIDNLARQTPFDYVEETRWNDDHTAVEHHVRLGYPRVGRRLDRVRFADGENILSSVPLIEGEDDYASAVVVVGAGEGRARVRGTASQRGTRLRRVAVVTDESVDDEGTARSLARDELLARQPFHAFQEITVDGSHPNAPLGSFSVGDDIPVTARAPWLGWVTAWHRITSYTWSPVSDTVTLSLRPSGAFRYGAP